MKKMITMIMMMAWVFAWAGEEAPETVVASDEKGVWLGPDEIVVASGVKGVWLGPDEIVVAFDEADFALVPPGAQKIGDEVYMYVNAEGALVVFGEGLKSPQFKLESLADSLVFRTTIRADGSLQTVPAVVVPGRVMALYGTESLENPDWREIDPDVTMRESGYHFFKFVLK